MYKNGGYVPTWGSPAKKRKKPCQKCTDAGKQLITVTRNAERLARRASEVPKEALKHDGCEALVDR